VKDEPNPDVGTTRTGDLRRLSNNVWLPAVIMLLLSTAFVAVRLERAAGGDVTKFVVAGSDLVDRACAPHGLAVADGPGYDGQFFFRIALNPADLRTESQCMRLDAPLRRGRITYPALAFAGSAGRQSLLPWTLVSLNIAALTALGAMGGVLARDAGRHVLWGLGLALYFGFVFSTGRDLGEVVEASLLIASLLALRKQRHWLAAAALSLTVLAREAALFFVAAYALVRLIALVRGRSRPGMPDVPWVAPIVAFVTWQAVCLHWGPLPLGHSGGDSLRIPGYDLVRALPHWVDRLSSGSGLLQVAEAATLLLVMILALVALPKTTALLHERIAFVLFFVFALSVSTPVGVWNEQFDFRVLSDTFLLAWVVILGSRIRLAVPMAALFACWLGAVALRVSTI
jgi:hypothetical protein